MLNLKIKTCEISEYINVMETVDIDLFFEQTIAEPNTGCWIWEKGKAGPAHYPRYPETTKTQFGGRLGSHKPRRANRVAWILENKKPIPNGLFACHKCDNHQCVNPSHIFVATQRENVLDMHRKGRWSAKDRTGLRTISKIFPYNQ